MGATIGASAHCLGSEAALAMHGYGGLDELTTGGPNRVSVLRNGKVTTFDLDAVDSCLPFRPCSLSELRGGDPPENARLLRDILSGKDRGPRRDVVLLNAAAALAVESCELSSDPCGSLRSTAAEAADSVDSGAALRKLDLLVAMSRELSSQPVQGGNGHGR